MTLAETTATALAIAGAFFTFVAGLGVVRLPDLFTRMHAASKATCFGVGLLAVAVAVQYPSGAAWLKAGLIVLFLFLTTPVASHLLARAAYRMRVPKAPHSGPDELENLLPAPRDGSQP